MLRLFSSSLYALIMQCNGTCPVEDGWDSMIAVGDQGARFVHITWTEDNQSSLYVVRYRQTNTQIYSSSLEVSDLKFCHYSIIILL